MYVFALFLKTEILNEVILPGHALVLQFLNSVDNPSHLFPPPVGTGLEQVRVLYCSPVPQLTVQVEYASQELHRPWTVYIKKIHILLNF